MAVYVPDSTRRRKLALLVVAGVVAGLLVGFLVGRATSEGIDDAVAGARAKARAATLTLERLDIEYPQALAAESGESMATIAEAVDHAKDQLDEAWAAATWLGAGARAEVDEALERLDAAIDERVELAELQDVRDVVVEEVDAAFGLSG